MKDKQYCVYKHVSPNGKIYIGQTCQVPEKRWKSGLGYKAHPHFYSAIQKYGWDNFEHVIIIDGLTKKEADWLEKYLISYYETMNPLKGYNHTKGGEGITGFKMSEESKQKMAKSLKGNKNSLGHTVSDEARQKIADVQRGNNHCAGRVYSDETRQKISEAMKGKKNTLGHTWSEEHKRKISEARKLYWEQKKQQKSA